MRVQPDDRAIPFDAAHLVLQGCAAAFLLHLTTPHDARQVALHIERLQRAELNDVGRSVVAEDVGKAPVDEQRLAVPFDADAGHGGFDQGSEPLLVDAEFLFGLFACADIDLHGDEVGDPAVGSFDRRDRCAAPVQRPVLPPVAEFTVPILAALNGRPEARGSRSRKFAPT